MTRLLALGDVHLGQGADLGRAPGDRLRDQTDVLGRVAGIAVERDVDAVLIAGDTFNGPAIPPEQLAVFADFVAACRLVEVPVVAITGNGMHDLAVRDTNGMDIFKRIDGIRVSSTPEIIDVAGVTVATLPWVHPGRLIAKYGLTASRDEINATCAELLVRIAAELLDAASGEGPRVLLGHWSVSGASLPTGLPTDLLREPVIPLDELQEIGFDALCLGHIHAPQMFGRPDAAPPVLDPHAIQVFDTGPGTFYVGSPMPLNFGETNVAHGVWILDTDAPPYAEFHPVKSRPLVTVKADLVDRGLDDPHAALTEVLDAEEIARNGGGELFTDAIVRLKYRATAEQQRHIDTAALRHWLLAADAHSVTIVPEIVRADRARVEGLDDQVDELDALDRWLDATAYQGDRERLRSRAALYLEAA